MTEGKEPIMGGNTQSIAAVIIKAGIEMLLETLDELLGKRTEREVAAAIRDTVCEDGAVQGAYDLILHSYGPERLLGSVHVEVADTMTAEEIDRMERRIAQNVFAKHGVILTGIGIYSVNTTNDGIRAMRTEITRLVMAHEGVLQMHGFYVDLEHKRVSFDIILDFALDDRAALFREIQEQVQAAYPDYELQMTMDIDI